MGNLVSGTFPRLNNLVGEAILDLGGEILLEKERREALLRRQRAQFQAAARRGGNPQLPDRTGFERIGRRELEESKFPEAAKGLRFKPDKNRMAQLYIGEGQSFDLGHPAFGIGVSLEPPTGPKPLSNGRNGLKGWYSDQIAQAIASARKMYEDEYYKGTQRVKDHYAQIEARLKRVQGGHRAPTLFRLRNYNPTLDDSKGWIYRPGFSMSVFMSDTTELAIASRGATELQGYMSVMGFEVPISIDPDVEPLLEIVQKVKTGLFPASKITPQSR